MGVLGLYGRTPRSPIACSEWLPGLNRCAVVIWTSKSIIGVLKNEKNIIIIIVIIILTLIKRQSYRTWDYHSHSWTILCPRSNKPYLRRWFDSRHHWIILISCDSNQVPKWFGTHYNLSGGPIMILVKWCYSAWKSVFGVARGIVQWAHYVAYF